MATIVLAITAKALKIDITEDSSFSDLIINRIIIRKVNTLNTLTKSLISIICFSDVKINAIRYNRDIKPSGRNIEKLNSLIYSRFIYLINTIKEITPNIASNGKRRYLIYCGKANLKKNRRIKTETI